jgi:hypothetical protein
LKADVEAAAVSAVAAQQEEKPATQAGQRASVFRTCPLGRDGVARWVKGPDNRSMKGARWGLVSSGRFQRCKSVRLYPSCLEAVAAPW